MQKTSILIALALCGCAIDPETDELDTSETEAESSVTQWNSFGYIVKTDGVTQESEYQPGLAPYNGLLYMVHSGSSDRYELWQSTYDGVRWSNDFRLPIRSTGGPSLVNHNGTLKMIIRSASANRLEMSTFVSGSFQPTVPIGAVSGTLRSEPAAGVFAGQLYVAYCTTGALRVDRLSGSSWANVMHVTTTKCADVELAVLPDTGQLHLYYADTGGWIYESRSSGGAFTAPSYILYKKTAQPMSIVSCNGVTHFVHGGHDDPKQVWWSERIYGGWTGDQRVGAEESYGGAALGCFNGTKAVMVHNSPSWNELKFSTFRQ